MIVALIAIGAVALAIAYWIKRARDRRELEEHSITPEALHALLASHREALVFDVRLPLDLLAASEIIPGAKRIAPKDVQENPSLIPQEKKAAWMAGKQRAIRSSRTRNPFTWIPETDSQPQRADCSSAR
jgi:hypothetical protein